MTQANHRPARRVSKEECLAVNKALFASIISKGLNGADRALKSGKIPRDVKGKSGESGKDVEKKLSGFLRTLSDRRKEFQEKCEKLRSAGLRRHKESYRPNPEKEKEKEPEMKVEESKVEKSKVEETPVEETKVTEQPTVAEK